MPPAPGTVINIEEACLVARPVNAPLDEEGMMHHCSIIWEIPLWSFPPRTNLWDDAVNAGGWLNWAAMAIGTWAVGY